MKSTKPYTHHRKKFLPLLFAIKAGIDPIIKNADTPKISPNIGFTKFSPFKGRNIGILII